MPWCALRTVDVQERERHKQAQFPLTLRLEGQGGTCSIGKPKMANVVKSKAGCSAAVLTLHCMYVWSPGLLNLEVPWQQARTLHLDQAGKSCMVPYCTTQSRLRVTGFHWPVHFYTIFQSAVGLCLVELTLEQWWHTQTTKSLHEA